MHLAFDNLMINIIKQKNCTPKSRFKLKIINIYTICVVCGFKGFIYKIYCQIANFHLKTDTLIYKRYRSDGTQIRFCRRSPQ